MPKVTLNDKSVRKEPPESGQVELWDKVLPGFGLRIAAGGARTYFIMKRLNGRLVRRTVGKAPPLHVLRGAPLAPGEFWPQEAREQARNMLTDLARGIDPAEATAAAKPAKTPETFGEVAASYFADASKRGGGSLRSRSELERKVRVDLAAWADKPIASITRADVRALINAKHAQSPISANRLLALVRRILRWAVRDDLIAANPAADIDPPSQEQERDRVLSLNEIKRIWQAADALGAPYGPAVKLMILTAQRRSEVGGLRWSEVSGGSWKLPDERAKRGKGHLIPLSPLAQRVLADLPKVGANPEYVFTTGRRAASKGQKIDPKAPAAPINGWSRVKRRLDDKIAALEAKRLDEPLDLQKHSLANWTLHDIRRSVSTHLRDADAMGAHRVERLVVSKVLNHAEGGVTRLYDRYSADPEKRAALDAWSHVVERLCGLNVLPLTKGKSA
jgi:integrase